MQNEQEREREYAPESEREEEGSSQLPLLGVGLAVLFATATFFSGMQIGSGTGLQASLGSLFGNTAQPDSSVDMSEFWQVWNLLEDKFVSSTTTEGVPKEERLHGAIQGLVDSYGDPYTVFMPPVEAAQFEEDISGNFSGVGMEVGIREGVVTIIAPLPDTPAEKAGLIAGDMIARIDDRSTDGMSIDQAVRLIRGEKGTSVKLTIVREGEVEWKEITVVRDTISVPTSATEQRGDVFIIKLYSFNALAEAEMQQALRKYTESGAKKLVLDLRGNPGGFLQSAVNIGSFFLPAGKVIVRENFGEGTDEHQYRSTGKQLKSLINDFTPESMVVLVDGGSASASEILAGALQEHSVAQLVGAQTFGKGSVQELVELSDGSSLKVTIARWMTPNGISISDGGLTPDVVVERTPQQYLDGEDPQLDEALKLLGGQ